MAYSGKTAGDKVSQLDTVAWTPKAPTYKPTYGGTFNSVGVKGESMERTSSPNAQDEKLFEKRPDAPTK